MSKLNRFALGGLGGLLPVLATLVAVDLTSIATLIDNHGLTEGLCVGYGIRVVGLFALGGIMAAVNSDVQTPLALVQLGIAAPALVTSYLTGSEINRTPPQSPPHASIFITDAHAKTLPNNNMTVVATFFDDVFKGITPGLGGAPADIINKRAVEQAVGLTFNVPFRIVRSGTQVCLDIPAEQVKSRAQYDSLVKSFPAPTYTVEPGVCKK